MPESLKPLGQAAPGAVLTSLYSPPAGKSAVVGRLVICNRAAAGKTYRVSVALAGAADDVKQYLRFDEAIAANSSTEIRGITLGATDELRVYGSDSNVSFSAFGSELS